MKVSNDYLRKLILESLQEITDLEAVGAEEVYGDDEEERHVRQMLSSEHEDIIERISRTSADVAGLSSTIKNIKGNPQAVEMLEQCFKILKQVETIL